MLFRYGFGDGVVILILDTFIVCKFVHVKNVLKQFKKPKIPVSQSHLLYGWRFQAHGNSPFSFLLKTATVKKAVFYL